MKNNDIYYEMSILDEEDNIIQDNELIRNDWISKHVTVDLRYNLSFPKNDRIKIYDNQIFTPTSNLVIVNNIDIIPDFISFRLIRKLKLRACNIKDFSQGDLINDNTRYLHIDDCNFPNGFKNVNNWINIYSLCIWDSNIKSLEGLCGNIDNLVIFRSKIENINIGDELYVKKLTLDNKSVPNNISYPKSTELIIE